MPVRRRSRKLALLAVLTLMMSTGAFGGTSTEEGQ